MLKKVDRGDLRKPEKILYSGNRWRDSGDFTKIILDVPKHCFVAPDKKTIIPDQYDLIRANCLIEAIPGKPFYCVDEYYKRVYRLRVDDEGKLSNPEVAVEEGEFCVIKEESNRLYVCDGRIRVFSETGTFLKEIVVPERPSTIAFGGKEGKTLFITARNSIYAIELPEK